MNKVSKKERNHSGKKCNIINKKGAQEVVKHCTTAAANTTEDLSEHLDKLTVQAKPVNGIINGNIKHEEPYKEKVTEPADTTSEAKDTRPSKGKSKNRRNGAKRNANQANQATTSANTTTTPRLDIDTISSLPGTSTSLDNSVSPRESLQEDCSCTLTNETNSLFFNDADISDDFDISAFIKARCEQARAQLNSKSNETSIKDKQSTLQEKPMDVVNTPEGDVKLANEEDLDVVKDPVIEYLGYESELQMPLIMRIIQKDLSEPYSIYTYRYFIHNWPNLCFLAMCREVCVGAIVCKLDQHRIVIKRGYIAMLAVDGRYRKHGIGSTLVRRAIAGMVEGGADEVVLETEITNMPALRLYEALGFVRDKRLFRYYLNGVDALRLKLWLR